MKDKFNEFSVPLGLLDYINPIFYTITIITVILNLFTPLGIPYNIILVIGAILSISFGFVIPTGKVLVGLRVIRFKLPVIIVLLVNTGILLSGLMISKYVFQFPILVLFGFLVAIFAFLVIALLKSNKFNTVAVLVGAVGYLIIYISFIVLSIRNHNLIPILLYGFAIFLFIMLCGIGIKADLKKAKIHWFIEISNIICQMSVAIATILLFSK